MRRGREWPYAEVRLESCVEVFTSALENTMNAVNKPRFPGNLLLMNNIHSRSLALSLSLSLSSGFLTFHLVFRFVHVSFTVVLEVLSFSSAAYSSVAASSATACPVEGACDGTGSSDSELSVWGLARSDPFSPADLPCSIAPPRCVKCFKFLCRFFCSWCLSRNGYQAQRQSFSVSFMFTYADLRDSIVSVWVWREDFVLLFSLELEAVRVRLLPAVRLFGCLPKQ